jgi:hypothetical protein
MNKLNRFFRFFESESVSGEDLFIALCV